MLSNIRLVEIEINSYCNRKCPWCPNKIIDRSVSRDLKNELYIKLLMELKENNFNGVISYSRYNEPFANIELFKYKLLLAQKILGNIKLVTNTNGDFLTKENLENLPINELSVMDYDCKEIEYCIEKLGELGAEITEVNYPFVKAVHKNMEIIYFVDWPMNALLEDRGGSLQEDIDYKGKIIPWKENKTIRHTMCFEPNYFIGIDYNGNIVPCCHIRSDNPEHYNYVLGNIKNNSITEIIYSQKAIEFRKATKNDMGQLTPCLHCHKQPGRYTRDNPGINFKE